MSVANASQHLQVLRAAHLVEVRREGVSMYYRLADEGVFKMWQALRTVGEAQLAEIDRVVQTFLHDRTRLQPMGAHELLHRLSDDQIILLDVRPTAEWAEWAIPGCIHVDAYDALKAHDPAALADVDVPSDIPVVTVCAAGKTSQIAAEQLAARGREAFSLDGGMKAWSLAWNIAEVPGAGDAVHVLQVRRTRKG